MPNKLIYLLWCAFLLAQCCHYAHASKGAHSPEFKKLSPRLQLFISVVSGSEPLHVRTVEKSETVFRKVLNDISVLAAPNAKLKAHLDRVSQYLAGIERMKVLSKSLYESEAATPPNRLASDMVLGALELASELVDWAAQFNSSAELPEPTMEDLLVRLSLEKNGFAQLLQKLDADFARFKPSFFVEMDEYVAELPAAEREKQAKIIDWYKQFKLEPRIKKFFEFFSFYTEEDMQTTRKFIFK